LDIVGGDVKSGWRLARASIAAWMMVCVSCHRDVLILDSCWAVSPPGGGAPRLRAIITVHRNTKMGLGVAVGLLLKNRHSGAWRMANGVLPCCLQSSLSIAVRNARKMRHSHTHSAATCFENVSGSKPARAKASEVRCYATVSIICYARAHICAYMYHKHMPYISRGQQMQP
jgi:hypothetical protein